MPNKRDKSETKHGGPRPGAGRPRVENEPRENHMVTLSAADWAALKRVGRGNASEGIRYLLRGRLSRRR